MSTGHALTFGADLPAGTLRLRLPAAQETVDAVDAAMLLARHESLITTLEVWLGAGIAPAPVDNASADLDHLPLVWAHADDGVQLGLDWALLSSIDPNVTPPLPLHWPALSFAVEVARFEQPPLPADPACSNEASGVLLLPPSFAAAWRVRLQGLLPQAPGNTCTLSTEAEWAGPGSPLMLSAPPQLRAPDVMAPCWTVVMNEPCWFTPAQLLGWSTELPPPISGEASLHGPALLQRPPRPGRIAPALGGAGLWL